MVFFVSSNSLEWIFASGNNNDSINKILIIDLILLMLDFFDEKSITNNV